MESATSGIRRPKARRVTRFKKILNYNERDLQLSVGSVQSLQSLQESVLSCGRVLRNLFRGRMCGGSPLVFETRLDFVFALVVLLSTLVMAIEMDADRTLGRTLDVWTVLDIVFSTLFWVELCCRLWLHGFRRHFCGQDRLLNALDAALVVTDTVQVISVLAYEVLSLSDAMQGVPLASLFRLLRIIRLARLVHVLKSPIFNDLITIANSLRGGLVTLSWSFVPFFLVLFTASLVCRETVGRGGVPNVGPYFDTVPRALLTMIRCGFGDFTSGSGTPIIEQMVEAYGLSWGYFYGVFAFFVSIGLFNVIAAVFIESTLTATATLQRAKLQTRLADKELWYSRVFLLVKGLLPHTGLELPDGDDLSEHAERIMAAEVQRHAIANLARSSEAMSQALRDLDIDPRDDNTLGDILDFRHTGHVTILDFVNGLQRLRGGDLRRSDVLSIDLMIRALQEQVDEMSHALRSLEESPGRGRPGQTHFI